MMAKLLIKQGIGQELGAMQLSEGQYGFRKIWFMTHDRITSKSCKKTTNKKWFIAVVINAKNTCKTEVQLLENYIQKRYQVF